MPHAGNGVSTTWSPGADRRDARADLLDHARGLVSEHHRQRRRERAVDHRQVGVAHPARGDAHEHLAGLRAAGCRSRSTATGVLGCSRTAARTIAPSAGTETVSSATARDAGVRTARRVASAPCHRPCRPPSTAPRSAATATWSARPCSTPPSATACAPPSRRCPTRSARTRTDRTPARRRRWPTAIASSSRPAPRSNGSGPRAAARSACSSRATTCTPSSARSSTTRASTGPVVDELGPAPAPFTSKLNFKRAAEGSEFPWHQDYPYWYTAIGAAAQDVVTAIVFLDDATADNGALACDPRLASRRPGPAGSRRPHPLPHRSGRARRRHRRSRSRSRPAPSSGSARSSCTARARTPARGTGARCSRPGSPRAGSDSSRSRTTSRASRSCREPGPRRRWRAPRLRSAHDVRPRPRRVALIADAGFFVGPALARVLAARGHDLALSNPEDGLVADLEGLGATVEVIDAPRDLADPGRVARRSSPARSPASAAWTPPARSRARS